MKQSPDKTDFSDARVLADLERVGYPPRVWIAPKALRELRTLVRDRQQLAAQRRNLKLQIGALLREHRRRSHNRWTEAWCAWLQGQAAADKPAGSWSNAYAASPGSNSHPRARLASSPAPTPPSLAATIRARP